jgi:hypothetical protein
VASGWWLVARGWWLGRSRREATEVQRSFVGRPATSSG